MAGIGLLKRHTGQNVYTLWIMGVITTTTIGGIFGMRPCIRELQIRQKVGNPAKIGKLASLEHHQQQQQWQAWPGHKHHTDQLSSNSGYVRCKLSPNVFLLS
ncbi:hypothetical protein PoB_001348600 [Plakobranchus ocellatus]|uniref:Uncharacterized protein n=1 Tax=Plakobranchus ocellatus TaxID=259542 RepID=A0AAV3YX65_9GAST|nr:hypothetical protein PoB_001348600 [Plakobranchus ocellatus]